MQSLQLTLNLSFPVLLMTMDVMDHLINLVLQHKKFHILIIMGVLCGMEKLSLHCCFQCNAQLCWHFVKFLLDLTTFGMTHFENIVTNPNLRCQHIVPITKNFHHSGNIHNVVFIIDNLFLTAFVLL